MSHIMRRALNTYLAPGSYIGTHCSKPVIWTSKDVAGENETCLSAQYDRIGWAESLLSVHHFSSHVRVWGYGQSREDLAKTTA